MTPERLTICAEVINKAAGYYARRCWWLDVQDLRQEGWAIALQAGARVDLHDSGFGGYVTNAVSRSLSRFCWAQSCLASSAKPGHELAGLTRCDLPPETGSYDPEAEVLQLEASRELLIARQGLRGRLRAMYNQRKSGMPVQVVHASIQVLLDGVASRQAAAAFSVPVPAVYVVTAWLLTQAKSDPWAIQTLRKISDARRELQTS
jgi:hypothetical protein